MTTALKVLGQVFPAATTLTPIYTVPSGKQATCSTVMVCNQSAMPTTFRISVAIAGAADNLPQYLYYDFPIAGADTFAATIGISLGSLDVVRCYAGTASLSFNLFGAEKTP